MTEHIAVMSIFINTDLNISQKWNGRNYIKIDTFYASSRLCFSCGYKNTNVKDL